MNGFCSGWAAGVDANDGLQDDVQIQQSVAFSSAALGLR